MNNNNEFYRFRCDADGEPNSAELLIFAAIGDWEDMGEVSAKAFAKELAKLPTSVKRLDIHINSPGGSLFEASAIYSRLADHRSKKIVYIDGLAASAASIVAMVGHKIYIRANASMMIHLPSGIVLGNADDMRKMATALDTVTESMINVYQDRTGLERDEIRELLANETWFSPDDAIEKGFADEVRGVVKAAASLGDNRYRFGNAEFDLSRFHNIPAFSAVQAKPKTTMKKKITAQTTEEEKEEENGEGKETEETKETPTPPTPPPQAPADPAAPVPPAPAATSDFDKGVKAERDRILALQRVDRPATHALVTAAIKDGKTVNDIFADCIEAMDKAQGQANRRVDASVLDGIPASDGGTSGDGESFGALVKDKVQSRLKRKVRVSRN
jgi:ATP-dependent protease ClpP protease subunit